VYICYPILSTTAIMGCGSSRLKETSDPTRPKEISNPIPQYRPFAESDAFIRNSSPERVMPNMNSRVDPSHRRRRPDNRQTDNIGLDPREHIEHPLPPEHASSRGRASRPSRHQQSPDNRQTVLVQFDHREYSEPPCPRNHASSYNRQSSITVFEED
jgi:hypothetical protein